MSLLARASDAYGFREAREYGRTAWLLTLGTLITGIGRGIVAPFLVLYLVQQRGIPLSVVGLGIAVEFAVRALVGPVAGSLSDRYGRKPLMVAGLLGTSVLLPSYLLVRDAPAFLAISVLNGLIAAHSLYGPASSALVADVVPPNRRGAVFGLMHASRNLGWTLGIALGALLVGFGFVPVFAAGGLLPLAFLVVVLLLVHDPARHAAMERPHPFRAWGPLLTSRLFLAYLALTVVFFLGWGQVNTIFPLWLVEGLGLPERAVSIIAINSALIFLFQLPFGRLADRVRRAMLLSFAALALGATYVVYVWTPVLAPAVPALLAVGVGVVAFTVAEMLYSPILSAYAADLAPRGTTGSALGVLAFATAIGQGAPPLLADQVAPRWGWGAVWGILAVLCVASAWGLAWFGRRVPAMVDRPS